MKPPLRALFTLAPLVPFGAAWAAAPAPVDMAAPAIPHDLSVWGMFAQADWVVKLVMIGLLIASIITWTVLVAKHFELARARRDVEATRAALEGAASLDDVAAPLRSSPLLREAEAEIAQSADALGDPEGLKERLVSRLDRYEARWARKATQGVTILATIGATAPFVGLFGTVWGIMNSFIGIAEKQTTNLAVVAPGIAEALLATALGLVAAIPAVVIYNHFARQIAAHRAVVADSAAALLRLVSRDLSRGTLGAGKA
ncbi:tonB-system energizer ExbB [Sphingopyxis sp. MWB1]|uniref:tonB-system energizer ExbB n=1 Tax=Sphingopyxis sp. MWB1 TaxID=1537715 RepID=UPI00068C010D|nr:tonB-system energizer ExbB [Sphingopyxis sp. MWB1]